MYTLSVWCVLLFSLLSVAFYTLFERKVLGLAQQRMGPNKVGVMGLLQPLLDALKLLLKTSTNLSGVPLLLFMIPSGLMLMLTLQVWGLVPSLSLVTSSGPTMLFMLIIMGMLVYNTILVGVVSKSKFGMLGAVRSACQAVSYEISLSFQLLAVCVSSSVLVLGESFPFSLSMLVFGLWWLSCFCECNRAPFDFAEGESELISGFNVEYSAVSFVFIFLAEYGMMLALSLMSSTMFFGSSIVVFIFLFFTFCLARATFPRYRFDLLMKFCWLSVLPLSICLYFIILIMSWTSGVCAHQLFMLVV